MDSACAGNDLLLADRYPELSFLLRFTPPDLNEPLLATTQDEIARFMQKWSLEGIDILYLYGLGSGEHYSALKSWLQGRRERKLIVLEDRLNQIGHFIQLPQAGDFLSDPQVHLCYFSKPGEAQIAELVHNNPSDRVEVAAIGPYAKRRRMRFEALRLHIFRQSAICHALMAESLHSHKLLANLVPNILRWPGAFFANRLKNRFHGIPAIICGAGPSLSKTWELLKHVDDRALVIAGGSTIAALSNHSIVPHLGLALDPNAEEFDRLKAAASFEMPLLFASRLEPHVLGTCNGERGYLLSQTGGPLETYMEQCAGIQGEPVGPEMGIEAFSVTTLAIALAVEMGCSPILLNGIDLAYTGMERYAAGVMPSSAVNLKDVQRETRAGDRLLRRKDIHGKPAMTLVKWVMESECIANYAKMHPETCFINVTAGGLGFRGIPNQSLHEALAKLAPAADDLRARVHSAIQELKFVDLRKEDLIAELSQLTQSLAKMHSMSEEMLGELFRLQKDPSLAMPTGKMALIEMDFQEEKGFEALFPIFGPTLDRLLNRSYYLSPLASEEEKRGLKIERLLQKWQQWKEVIEVKKLFLTNAL